MGPCTVALCGTLRKTPISESLSNALLQLPVCSACTLSLSLSEYTVKKNWIT
jgi:hypothetical protein